jgi:hypothetical protein
LSFFDNLVEWLVVLSAVPSVGMRCRFLEVPYKEIVAMDIIAKLLNPMTLASAAQDIWEHCHA